MIKRRHNVFVGLDVGSYGIAVAVFKAEPKSKWELLGVGYAGSAGVTAGLVHRPDETADAVQKAVKEAELAAGVPINNVGAVVSWPGLTVHSFTTSLEGSFNQHTKPMIADILRRNLTPKILPAHCSILQLIEVFYYIDGEVMTNLSTSFDGLLKIEALALVAPTQPWQAWQQCFRRVGLKVTQTVAGALAMGEAVLTSAERELGVVCVDLGASLTSTAYFSRGKLRQTAVFPIGSDHITADLAMGLRTNLPTAESKKINDGLKLEQNTGSFVATLDVAKQNRVNAPHLIFDQIISSRLEEILDYIKQFISALNLTTDPPGGVVMIGGGARLTGLQQFAQKYLALPVRLGTSPVLTGVVPAQDDYRYLSVIGLAFWEQRQRRQLMRMRPPKSGLLGQIKKRL